MIRRIVRQAVRSYRTTAKLQHFRLDEYQHNLTTALAADKTRVATVAFKPRTLFQQ